MLLRAGAVAGILEEPGLPIAQRPDRAEAVAARSQRSTTARCGLDESACVDHRGHAPLEVADDGAVLLGVDGVAEQDV